MIVALVNSSPKIKDSNSALILSDLKHYITNKCELIEASLCFNADFNKVYNKISQADAWVFAFPLYVDNMPSHLLSFLEWIDDNKSEDKKRFVYAVANCGFYEGIQTQCAVNTVEFWCNKTGNTYSGSVGVGGGEAFSSLKNIPIGHGPKADIDKALCSLAQAIMNSESIDNKLLDLNYPRFLYKIGATGRWKKLIRKNGGKVRDLGRKLS